MSRSRFIRFLAFRAKAVVWAFGCVCTMLLLLSYVLCMVACSFPVSNILSKSVLVTNHGGQIDCLYAQSTLTEYMRVLKPNRIPTDFFGRVRSMSIPKWARPVNTGYMEYISFGWPEKWCGYDVRTTLNRASSKHGARTCLGIMFPLQFRLGRALRQMFLIIACSFACSLIVLLARLHWFWGDRCFSCGYCISGQKICSECGEGVVLEIGEATTPTEESDAGVPTSKR